MPLKLYISVQRKDVTTAVMAALLPTCASTLQVLCGFVMS
jgi:hypothetical protein